MTDDQTQMPTAQPRNQILVGDATTTMGSLEPGSIDAVITSPPYYRLRDYGHDGQLGLESSIGAYVSAIRDLGRAASRVLVPTGTFWLNLGDTYATHPREGAPAKSLVAAPERVMLALIEDGWIVRNKIVWAKTNPIPTSVRDRLATTYEVIYVMARQRRYHFDLDAIRKPHKSRRGSPLRPGAGVNPSLETPPPKAHMTARGQPASRPPGRRDPHRPAWRGPNADGDLGLRTLKDSGLPGHPLGKNPGDVWRLATSRYRGAHFATYPQALAERMIRAGVPEARCTSCRAPWQRPVRRLGATALRLALAPTCGCGADSEPGIVLDPFLGSGTTAIAAENLGRDWLGIELNPAYGDLARERLAEARSKKKRKKGTGQSGGDPP